MWEYFEDIHGIASPQIKYSIFLDYISEIDKELAIGENFASGLIYMKCYDVHVFDSLDWGDYRFTDYSCKSAWDEALWQFPISLGNVFFH